MADRAPRPEIARNRELILDTVEEMFLTHGLTPPMNEIAKQAGLGPATVYRRFASHEDIVRALYDRASERFHALVLRAADEPTGWEAVVTFLTGAAELNNTYPVIPAAARRMGQIDPSYRPTDAYFHVLDDIAERAKREGTLRADVAAVDLGIITVALGSLAVLPEPARTRTTARQLQLVLAGLRPESVRFGSLPDDGELRTEVLYDLVHDRAGTRDLD